MIIVETNCVTKENAVDIANALFNSKFIANANIWKLDSMYLRNQKIDQVEEWRLSVVTAQLTVEDVFKLIQEMHVSENPIIWSNDPSRVTSQTKLWLKSVIDSF